MNQFTQNLYTIFSLEAAISSASTSGVSFAYAFFEPSGRIRVLTFTQSTSYNCFNAALICVLFELAKLVQDVSLCTRYDKPDVDDENKGIVLLDLLHRTLRVQGIEKDTGGIETVVVLI